jgi:hypothetical protein
MASLRLLVVRRRQKAGGRGQKARALLVVRRRQKAGGRGQRGGRQKAEGQVVSLCFRIVSDEFEETLLSSSQLERTR